MNAVPQRARGFTLVEVLIAVLVVALGIGALLTTLTSSADTIGRLRDKSFAQWIALNQIATQRLSGTQPAVGITSGTLDYAGNTWRWEQEVSDPGVDGLLRVEVRVARQKPAMDSDAPDPDKPMAAIGTADGFVSSSVDKPSGRTPDWTLAGGVQFGGGGGGGGTTGLQP
ncbi:MAG TPA: type II secretion system minor pseudopilin GspI [Steroidobacteraceae bacterium]|nr:type II secretion system minor pseudopilin GspI [Steroidobacteraceae bacterium]